MRERARTLAVSDTEGDPALYHQIVTALRTSGELLFLRFKYLNVVPWSFANADTPDGAGHFLLGARQKPLSDQDELTRYLYEKHRAALDCLAAGGACAPALDYEVSVMNETPLDESAGEGYHRDTHIARLRASNAKSPYLKQSTRTKQNIALLRRYLKLGRGGSRVVRFEWRKWSRVLQARPDRLWHSKKLRAKAAFAKIYRMDEQAEEDWSLVCSTIHAPGQGPPPARDDDPTASQKQQDGLRIEYLQSVFAPQTWYRVKIPQADLDDVGEPVEREETRYFQILQMASGQSRPHVMPTIESHDDVMLLARMALNIQEGSEHVDQGGEEDQVLVYMDTDPHWISWKDVGPWQQVHRTLTRFKVVLGSAEQPGCLQLSDSERAVPMHALTDLKCPTLVILKELRRRGWQSIRGRVVHQTTDIASMDGREAKAMKAYFIVLLELGRCLPLTSRIPSDQPLLYYKLLLQGRHVEPDLGQRTYLALQRDADYVPEPAPVDDGEEVFFFRPRPMHPPPLPPPDLALPDIGDVAEVDPRGALRPPAKPRGPPVSKSGSSRDVVPAPPPKAPRRPKEFVPPPPPRAPQVKLPPPPVPLPLPDDEEIYIAPAEAPKPPPPVRRGARAAQVGRDYIPAIGGGGVCFTEYFPVNRPSYANWMFQCPHHHNCFRTMGLGPRNTSAHGELEPLAYLHVWRDVPPHPDKTHRNTDVPDRAAVTAFFEAHQPELQALADLFQAAP